jgi:hypothetical protein
MFDLAASEMAQALGRMGSRPNQQQRMIMLICG